MRALLLGSGPSLDRFPGPRRDHDVIIAVNSAVRMCPVDWWVFGDLPVYREHRHMVKLAQLLFVKHDWSAHELIRQEAYDVKRHPRIPYSVANTELGVTLKQSGPAALALAVMLRAEIVECWGVDMEGGERPERWLEERKLWDYLAGMTQVVRR